MKRKKCLTCDRRAYWPKDDPIFCTVKHAANYGYQNKGDVLWCDECDEWTIDAVPYHRHKNDVA